MISKYYWNFGDGFFSTEKNPVHIFKMPGVYTVLNTVTDETGNESSDTTDVTVSEEYDVTTTNQSFKFGLTPDQGIFFSENAGGDYPMPEPGVGVINITDRKGNQHTLVRDKDSRKFYAIDMYDGPSGTNNTMYWKDKVEADGTGGTELTPDVWFIEDRGESERFFMEMQSGSTFVRPVKKSYRDASGYDSNGFPDGLTFDFSVYKDGEQTTETVKAEDVSVPKHEVHFDRLISDANRIQGRITANKAPFRITGRQFNYVVDDKQDDPDGTKSNEDTWQENLATPSTWLSRGGGVTNKATGVDFTVVGTPAYVTGPDSKSESALTVPTSVDLGNDLIADGMLLLWHKTGYTISGISLTEITTSGSWILSKATGALPASLTLTTGDVFDVRIYDSSLNDATVTYYQKDVISNSGDSTMDVF